LTDLWTLVYPMSFTSYSEFPSAHDLWTTSLVATSSRLSSEFLPIKSGTVAQSSLKQLRVGLWILFRQHNR